MARTAHLMAVIPNALSIGRMVLGISFPWIPANWRVAVIIAAALSDLADGASSRQLQVTSSTGRFLDPVADKVFVLMPGNYGIVTVSPPDMVPKAR